jgi:hypothetical protein
MEQYEMGSAKLCEQRINKLIKLREKLRRERKQKHNGEMIGEIICGICNVKSIGLQIPNSPVIVCFNCIYATVLEHQTKKDWVIQQSTMMKENSNTERNT